MTVNSGGGGAVAEDFAEKVAQLAQETDLVKAVKQSLTAILGETTSSIIIYHLGSEALQDPKILEKKLKAILGKKGAEIIPENILKNLESRQNKMQ